DRILGPLMPIPCLVSSFDSHAFASRSSGGRSGGHFSRLLPVCSFILNRTPISRSPTSTRLSKYGLVRDEFRPSRQEQAQAYPTDLTLSTTRQFQLPNG